MRVIRIAFLALLAVVILTITLANRGMVTLRLLPDEIARFVGTRLEITLPLFLVILLGIVAGLLIGFFWEWLREHRYRAMARQEHAERVQLEREVRTLRTPRPGSGDEVLAILDGRPSTR